MHLRDLGRPRSPLGVLCQNKLSARQFARADLEHRKPSLEEVFKSCVFPMSVLIKI